METVGLMGAGVMGLTAARNIIDAGHPLFVYDVSSRAITAARDMGASIADSPAHAADQSDIILMFLPGPAQVEQCVAGPDGLLSSQNDDMMIVDMSTVDPGITRRMSALAREKKIGYLDAPVLGRPIAVGKWALPVGGAEDDLKRCRQVLKCVASKIIYVGPSGTGNKIKLLNQLMFGAINAMTAEMMAIAKKMGVSSELLYNTITASQAGTVSNLFKELGNNIVGSSYDNATFTVDLLIKDLRLAVEMAKSHQAPPVLARTIELINEMAQAQGYGSKDTSVMWKSYESLWGKE